MNRLVTTTLLVLCTAGPLRAQSADSKPVQDAVEAFLLHLGDHDFDRTATDMTSKSIIVVVRERNGEWTNTFQTGEEWIAALKHNPNPVTFREPLTNVHVTVDSDRLAYLRADFQVVREGKALSHGVDQFTLVRERPAGKSRRSRTRRCPSRDADPAPRHRHRRHSPRQPRPHSRRAPRRARSTLSPRGIDLALVTGRSFHFTRPVVEQLALPRRSSCNNGAVVKAQTDDTRAAPPAAAAGGATGARRYASRHEDSVAVVFDRRRRRAADRLRADGLVAPEPRAGYYEKNKAFIARHAAPLADVLTDDPIQVMFNGASRRCARSSPRCARCRRGRPSSPSRSTEYEHRDFSLVDVNAAGCSKGSTLARWTESRRHLARRSVGGRRQPERHRDALVRRHRGDDGQRQPFPVGKGRSPLDPRAVER